ncbi:MAG: hypothetical protein HY392_01250 [Candidatus Diapherotrites archaeon]|nr:hypothetical protein [Candidatus Diapherotrites archaeon]
MLEENFLSGLFRKYYQKAFIDSFPEVEKREFGVGEFGKKISSRHLSFRSAQEFNSFLARTAPFFVSFSPAYYSFPSARPMEAKGFLKSDLAYEFDADDIPTDCKLLHDSWKCPCGESGKGRLKNCPVCGKGVEVDEWVCPECISETKRQAIRLVDFFEKDFGIADGLFFNYSGSKGFHIHLRNELLLGLSPGARVEIVDYLTANSLDAKMHGFYYSKETKRFSAPKRKNALGWALRIHERLEGFFSLEADMLAAAGGISMKTAQQVLSGRKKFLESLGAGVLCPVGQNKTEKFWSGLVSLAVEEEKLLLDRQTSVDIKKILRVPDSLHGSTGLCAKKLSLEELKSFSALDSAVVFGGEPIKLKSVNAPRFYLGKTSFGPFEEQEAELPEFAAAYLVAKGHAKLRGQ